jgi:hypothetical protein
VENRDKFIIVQLPNETLIYNETISNSLGIRFAWTIVDSKYGADLNAWRGVNGTYDTRIPGWLYGDKIDGTIGRLDDTTAGQYGDKVTALLYTPFVPLDGKSIDRLEVDTITGWQSAQNDVKTFISLSYDGLHYETEFSITYSEQYNHDSRFIFRRLGNVNDKFAMKLRTISTERLAFGGMSIDYG